MSFSHLPAVGAPEAHHLDRSGRHGGGHFSPGRGAAVGARGVGCRGLERRGCGE